MSAAVETINLSHHPASLPVHVALYQDVQNAAFLRQQLITGNADFEYAFIDASMVGHRRLRLDSRNGDVSNMEYTDTVKNSCTFCRFPGCK